MNMKNAIYFVGIIGLAVSLGACSKPFHQPVFLDKNYGPWQSDLGRENILCYGRKTNLNKDCGTHMFVTDNFKTNPEKTALSPDVIEQIRLYAASAGQDTSASFKSGGLIYKLAFDTPKPKPGDDCRSVNIRVRPSGSDVPWHHITRDVCF